MIRSKMRGKDEIKKRQEARIRALMADGPMGRKVVSIIKTAHATARSVVHKDTRALWASMEISIRRHSATNISAQVALNPSAKNPRTKQRPAVYGQYENARGGDHAWLDITRARMKNTEIVAIAELSRIILEAPE